MADALLVSALVAAFFMIVEVFILASWIKSRERAKDLAAWTPFRKLFLDALVDHFDELMKAANQFEYKIEAVFHTIRNDGQLTDATLAELEHIIVDTADEIEYSERKFFSVVQTVSVSLQPYAAQYCNEVLWFSSSFRKALRRATIFLEELKALPAKDNLKTSHPLNGLSAMLISVKMWRDFRFKDFKQKFTQSVWKEEMLHFFEPDNEFLSREDYAISLDAERSAAGLNKIPRTAPIKSFFDA